MARRYFGTDGVRGVVGETLTADLVERLGKAAALWSGGGRVFVGRDTRASGPELEAALARGVVSAGGTAVLGGVLPTPAVALLAGDALGVVISASHNPPEYNGVKIFAPGGRKLTDVEEADIEARLDSAGPGGGAVERDDDAARRYVGRARDLGVSLAGMEVLLDCANGAYSEIAPEVFRQLDANVEVIGAEPDGTNINVGCGATDLRALRREVVVRHCDLGIAFDGDGDRMLAVSAEGDVVDGDQILAILAVYLEVDVVVVTSMTNLGFHRLMEERGVRVVTTDVGDRYVLEAMHAEGAVLGGEQSGHIIYLDGHVTGDGLVAGLLLCGALLAPLGTMARLIPRLPQATENVEVRQKELPEQVVAEVRRLNAALEGRGRILVRPSGTEPVVRVLAEARGEGDARRLCGTIAALVRRALC